MNRAIDRPECCERCGVHDALLFLTTALTAAAIVGLVDLAADQPLDDRRGGVLGDRADFGKRRSP